MEGEMILYNLQGTLQMLVMLYCKRCITTNSVYTFFSFTSLQFISVCIAMETF